MSLGGHREIPPTTYWITKWALAKGIQPITVTQLWDAGDGTIYISGNEVPFCRIGKDAFDNEDAARGSVVAMIDAKLMSQDRQRFKLLKQRAELTKP